MDRRAIGIFDSGLGGLTAVREMRKLLPGEQIIYFGDTGRVPYGGRSEETIIRYAKQDIRFLESFDIKAILVACGTVSSHLSKFSGELKLPVLGVVEPAAAEAKRLTKNRRIGVIGTAATVRSGCYERSLGMGVETLAVACPLFVPLVENGRTRPGDIVIETVAREYLEPLREFGCDTLILGCTHYPLLREVIAATLPGVQLVDSGAAGAGAMAALLRSRELLTCETDGAVEYHVSDDPAGFDRLASLFLGVAVDASAEKVDIENY